MTDSIKMLESFNVKEPESLGGTSQILLKNIDNFKGKMDDTQGFLGTYGTDNMKQLIRTTSRNNSPTQNKQLDSSLMKASS